MKDVTDYLFQWQESPLGNFELSIPTKCASYITSKAKVKRTD